jgi:hypothetical protein
MDDIDPAVQGVVHHAMDLLNIVQGVSSMNLKPLTLHDFTRYEFELVNYLQHQLAVTRPKPKLT